ncbi:MAG: 30S ribosomal protein S18 [Candidatus Pacebacteria bacterium]|jgi:small subunit ribosomal protein S18|nr:30S ribosomal protein S18 [Candidatus Paceibacterota bacterium]|tara:strand:- start:6664 stop:6864 length:201 start_codon:yes stop_codon:yes gene_type:complete
MAQNFFSANNIKYIDYKDVELLKRFLKSHGRITQRKVAGITAEDQRKLAVAIKRARFMGLLPYIIR